MAWCLAEPSPDWNVRCLIQNIAISYETPLSKRLNHDQLQVCCLLETACFDSSGEMHTFVSWGGRKTFQLRCLGVMIEVF